MSTPLKITAIRAAWMPASGEPDKLLSLIEKGNTGAAIDQLYFYGSADKKSFCDYVRVGDAEITVTMVPRDQQVAQAVEKLNEQLQTLRAAYMERQQEILDRISKLQCLEMTGIEVTELS